MERSAMKNPEDAGSQDEARILWILRFAQNDSLSWVGM